MLQGIHCIIFTVHAYDIFWYYFLLWFILFVLFCDSSNLAPSVGLNSNSQTALQDIIAFVKSRYEEQNICYKQFLDIFNYRLSIPVKQQ